jgi:hypothetical protein
VGLKRLSGGWGGKLGPDMSEFGTQYFVHTTGAAPPFPYFVPVSETGFLKIELIYLPWFKVPTALT